MLASMDERFWELKESAKWSLDVKERKRAIRELANSYGPSAMQSIAEIRDIAAYDEIRKACMEAIKSAAAASRKTPRKSRLSSAKKIRKRKKGKKKN
jgi:hypothetical protein